MVTYGLNLSSQAQKLEPWLVNGVKVAGGLDVSFALAKGLPVSEDHNLVSDLKQLKAPLITRKRIIMLIGVFSTGNNFKRRMALRRSWMQYEAVRSGDVAVRFFIGLVSNNCALGGVYVYVLIKMRGVLLLCPFLNLSLLAFH